MAKKTATILGLGLLTFGALGFAAPDFLGAHLGAAHSVVHLASGAIALAFGTKAAGVFGEEAALRALLAGERHGRNEYDQALSKTSVDATSKAVVRDVLKPRQEQHIRTLEQAVETN